VNVEPATTDNELESGTQLNSYSIGTHYSLKLLQKQTNRLVSETSSREKALSQKSMQIQNFKPRAYTASEI